MPNPIIQPMQQSHVPVNKQHLVLAEPELFVVTTRLLPRPATPTLFCDVLWSPSAQHSVFISSKNQQRTNARGVLCLFVRAEQLFIGCSDLCACTIRHLHINIHFARPSTQNNKTPFPTAALAFEALAYGSEIDRSRPYPQQG